MTISTSLNISLDYSMWDKYLSSLINKFFKILPILENSEDSIDAYLESLQSELSGLQMLVVELGNDPSYISLLAVLSWIAESASPKNGSDEVSFKRIRREVFHAISICKKIKEHYENAMASDNTEVD